MFTSVPNPSAVPAMTRRTPTRAAITSTAIAVSCGQICRHGMGARPLRSLGVTTKPSLRPNQTFAAAVQQARIHSGKSASAYCWPRQVLSPLAATRNISWLRMKYGRNRAKKSTLHAVTGMIPVSR